MRVYRLIRREDAKAETKGNIVGVRWVDVMKGDECRSRRVAQ